MKQPTKALVLSPWTGGFVGPLIDAGFVVTTFKHKNKTVLADLLRRFGTDVNVQRLHRADVLVSFDEPITNTILNKVDPSVIIACKESMKSILVDFDWVYGKVQCIYYSIPEAKDIPLFIAVRKGKIDKKAIDTIMDKIGNAASTTASIVKDVIPNMKRFLLHPNNGRSLFSTDRPCPEIKKNHWPMVTNYKASPADIAIDKGDAENLTTSQIATIHRVDPPPPTIPRRDGFEAIVKTFPVPLATVVTKALVETIIL